MPPVVRPLRATALPLLLGDALAPADADVNDPDGLVVEVERKLLCEVRTGVVEDSVARLDDSVATATPAVLTSDVDATSRILAAVVKLVILIGLLIAATLLVESDAVLPAMDEVLVEISKGPKKAVVLASEE